MIGATLVAYADGAANIAHAFAPKIRAPSLRGRLRKEALLRLLGETFVVSSKDRTKRVRMQLFDIYDIHETAETEQFSLVFRAPAGVRLSKGLYRIRHREAGDTTLFLQPRGADEFNRFYEAPFNLLP
jgi:hypothetical protein